MSAPYGRTDRVTARYFVYTLTDENGAPVYVGRSCNVAKRINQHHKSLTTDKPSTWILDVRSVSMAGPYNFDEAVAAERETVRRVNPRANVLLKRVSA